VTTPDVESFEVSVASAAIDDLRERLARTRWPDQVPGSGWDYGTDLTYLQELCDYWRNSFDWDAFVNRFNRFPQITTTVREQRVHSFHVRSPEPAARPLLLSHGWPGSVAEFLDVLGPLTDPVAFGGDPGDAFTVVAPSLPGYGFSGPTGRRGFHVGEIAECFDQLMAVLGYDRYFAQGGDWGALITAELAETRPDRVAAIHLNMLPAPAPPREERRATVTAAESADLQRAKEWGRQEAGYQAIQSTKPQTVAYGLNDSPAGLAGWIVEKFRAWSDCGGEIERSFTKDRLLDNISVYWLTGTIGSSMRLYYEAAGQPRAPSKVTVPTGHTRFPAEIYHTPRNWADRVYDIRSWRTAPRGGHFAAMEVPDLFVDEVRTFFREFR
jgi:epoxide hydrolase